MLGIVEGGFLVFLEGASGWKSYLIA